MKTHVNSKPRNTSRPPSRPKPKRIKPTRLKKIRRINHDNQHHGPRPSIEIKSKSSDILLARSKKFLNGLLEKYGATRSKGDIFKSLLALWRVNAGDRRYRLFF
jgi:hypothetical protein